MPETNVLNGERQPEETTSAPEEFSIRAALAILGQQKAFIILVCLSSSLTALALTYIASEKYESATTIAYRPQEITRLKFQEKQAFGATPPLPPFDIIKKNLEELVRSETILRKVVLELKLHEPIEISYDHLPWYERYYRVTKDYVKDKVYDAWEVMKYGRLIEDEPADAAVKGLRQNTFLIDKTSYIFYIAVRDIYPRRAAVIVDTIGKHLVEYLREEQRQAGAEKQEQLGELLREKQSEIERYRRQIQELLTSNEIISPTLEGQQAMSRWSELELTRVQLEAQITETKAQLADTDRYYRGGVAVASGGADVDGDASLDDAALLQPGDYRRLESQRLFTEIELSGLEAKYDSLLEAIAEVEGQRQVLPALEKRLNDLETRLEVAKRDYLQFTDAYQEAVVQAAGATGEAEILHAAVAPARPVAPIKVYHVGLALFLGLFVAIGLVYLFTFAEIYVLFPPKPPVDKSTGRIMASDA